MGARARTSAWAGAEGEFVNPFLLCFSASIGLDWDWDWDWIYGAACGLGLSLVLVGVTPVVVGPSWVCICVENGLDWILLCVYGGGLVFGVYLPILSTSL